MDIFTKHIGKKQTGRGFTLVELLVAISIVAILGTIGFTTYSQSQMRARDAKRKQDLRALATALELYYQSYKHYPCTSNYVSSSGGGNWIQHNAAYDATACGTSSDTFTTKFISQMPLDPLHPSKSYVYFGRGDGWAGPPVCTTKTGQSYILIAILENDNDPETHAKKQYKICGTLFNAFGNNAFIISEETRQ